jgi:serine/threonine kinase PknH
MVKDRSRRRRDAKEVQGRTHTQRITTPANTAQSRLLGTLPAGSGTCTKKDRVAYLANALAAVECGQNTNLNGPKSATYALFADADALSQAFDGDRQVTDLMTCPGSGPSPQPWRPGMIACATYKGQTNLIWSNQDELVLGDVYGDPPAIAELYQWWRSIS